MVNQYISVQNLLQIKVDLQHIAVKHLSSTQINELHIKN